MAPDARWTARVAGPLSSWTGCHRTRTAVACVAALRAVGPGATSAREPGGNPPGPDGPGCHGPCCEGPGCDEPSRGPLDRGVRCARTGRSGRARLGTGVGAVVAGPGGGVRCCDRSGPGDGTGAGAARVVPARAVAVPALGAAVPVGALDAPSASSGDAVVRATTGTVGSVRDTVSRPPAGRGRASGSSVAAGGRATARAGPGARGPSSPALAPPDADADGTPCVEPTALRETSGTSRPSASALPGSAAGTAVTGATGIAAKGPRATDAGAARGAEGPGACSGAADADPSPGVGPAPGPEPTRGERSEAGGAAARETTRSVAGVGRRRDSGPAGAGGTPRAGTAGTDDAPGTSGTLRAGGTLPPGGVPGSGRALRSGGESGARDPAATAPEGSAAAVGPAPEPVDALARPDAAWPGEDATGSAGPATLRATGTTGTTDAPPCSAAR